MKRISIVTTWENFWTWNDLESELSPAGGDFPNIGFCPIFDQGYLIVEVDGGTDVVGDAVEDIPYLPGIPILDLDHPVFLALGAKFIILKVQELDPLFNWVFRGHGLVAKIYGDDALGGPGNDPAHQKGGRFKILFHQFFAIAPIPEDAGARTGDPVFLQYMGGKGGGAPTDQFCLGVYRP